MINAARPAFTLCLSAALTLLGGCAPDGSKVKLTYGPWETFGPGMPPDGSWAERPTVAQLLRAGTGPLVAAGDLVEVHLMSTEMGRGGRKAGEYDDGRYWVWVAWDDEDRPAFPAGNAKMAAVLLGQKQGALMTLADNPRARSKGLGVGSVPFGDGEAYRMHQPVLYGRSHAIHADQGPGQEITRVEISRVCQGQATQRTIEALDESLISIAQDIGRTHDTREPRWIFLREAQWVGRCNDGLLASFRHGPIGVDTPPGRSKGLNISQEFGPWMQKAWAQLPGGVEVHKP